MEKGHRSNAGKRDGGLAEAGMAEGKRSRVRNPVGRDSAPDPDRGVSGDGCGPTSASWPSYSNRLGLVPSPLEWTTRRGVALIRSCIGLGVSRLVSHAWTSSDRTVRFMHEPFAPVWMLLPPRLRRLFFPEGYHIVQDRSWWGLGGDDGWNWKGKPAASLGSGGLRQLEKHCAGCIYLTFASLCLLPLFRPSRTPAARFGLATVARHRAVNPFWQASTVTLEE